MASGFPRFRNLPAELRDKIWRASLPHVGEASVSISKKQECRRVGELATSDPDYVEGSDNVVVDFRTEVASDNCRFHVPLILVNHEAHNVALAWLRKQQTRLKPLQHQECFFTNPEIDLVYKPGESTPIFSLGNLDQTSEPGPPVCYVVEMGAGVTKVTVSKDRFW